MISENNAGFSTSIRFTSIEPFEPHVEKIREIAFRHGFDMKLTHQSTLNAPFCGCDYHVQEVCLTHVGCHESAASTLGSCLTELCTFERNCLADGYFEVVG